MKWDLPPTEPPFWLDKHAELNTSDTLPPMTPAEFVLACCVSLMSIEPTLSAEGVFEVTANAVVETGWGKYRRGNNLGGWKINKNSAGPGVRWFRARGNKAPGATITDLKGGDPPWCYYLVFGSFGEYFSRWLKRFVPKPGSVSSSHLYFETGHEFWAGKPWFDDLCAAGYKGENTKAHPEGTIHEMEQITDKIAKMFVQSKLGVAPDGDWGPASTLAAKKKGWGDPTGAWGPSVYQVAFTQ